MSDYKLIDVFDWDRSVNLEPFWFPKQRGRSAGDHWLNNIFISPFLKLSRGKYHKWQTILYCYASSDSLYSGWFLYLPLTSSQPYSLED